MSRPDPAIADLQLPPGVAEGLATMPALLRHRARHMPGQIALREKNSRNLARHDLARLL